MAGEEFTKLKTFEDFYTLFRARSGKGRSLFFITNGKSMERQSQANAIAFSIYLWLLKKFGLRYAYILLRFVAAYYLFFSPLANVSLKAFFHKINLLQPDSISNRYKVFYIFGQSIIDKIALYMGVGRQLTFDFNNEAHSEACSEEKEPYCLESSGIGRSQVIVISYRASIHSNARPEHGQIKAL